MTLKAAQRSWKMWHQKEPGETLETSVDFPKTVYSVGTAKVVTYLSDKWEDDGDFYDYVHDFDTDPEVFMVDGDGAAKSVSKLLGVRKLSGELAMPILAKVKELIYMPSDGRPQQIMRFVDHPLMTCTRDLKTLVIFSQQRGPIFIRGGKMVVTERGIVR